MLLSIIIPHYNNTSRLKSLLNSINVSAIYAKFYDFETIIINDSPEINFLELNITCEYSILNIKVIDNINNCGVAYSRNKGFSISVGKYITFIDQDDLVNINYINIVINNLKNDDRIDAFILGSLHYWESENKYSKIFYTKPSFTLSSIIRSCHILTPGMIIFRRSSFVSEFRCVSIDYPGSDDWYLYLSLLSIKKFTTKFISKDIFVYVTHNDNVSNNILKLKKSSLLTIENIVIPKYKLLRKIKIYLLSKSIFYIESNRKLQQLLFANIDKIFSLNFNSIIYKIFK